MKKWNVLMLLIAISFVFACGKSTSSTTSDTEDSTNTSTVIQILSVVPANTTSKISAHIKNISSDPITISSYTVRAMNDGSSDPVAQATLDLEESLNLTADQKFVISADLGSAISSHNDYDYLRFTFNVTINHSETTSYSSLSLDY